MCYHCTKTSNSDGLMLSHLRRWHRSKELKVRVQILDATSGIKCYQTKIFPISISQLDQYDVISINFKEGKIIKRNKYKPTHSATKFKDHCAKDVGDLLREATSLIPDVLAALGKEDNARQEDFVQVLRSIHAGMLSQNISLMLHLDVGHRMGLNKPTSMRYAQETKRFWLAFRKLGRGKMSRFMTGMR